MRKRTFLAGLGLAGLLVVSLVSGSNPDLGEPPAASRSSAIDRRAGLRGPELAKLAGTAPMPAHDARIDAFLAEQPLDGELRTRLVDLARLQRVTYAPRPADQRETADARADRRERRAEFRTQVREVVTAMPESTRAALRRHNVNLVRLAQAIEAQ